MFETAIGDLGISPKHFLQMSIREVALAIEGKNNAIERDYNLLFLSQYNASGVINGGKKFKIINPFEKKNIKHFKPNKEEYEATIQFLNSFNE